MNFHIASVEKPDLYLGFSYRIALTLVPIFIIGIGITGTLSLYKFEQTFADLLTSRFEFVTNEIRKDIETQMDFGLPLDTIQITDVLEAYQRDDKQILSIEVFDNTGSVLYSSDPTSVGDLVSESWITLWYMNVNNNVWSTQEIDAGVVGIPVRNNLGQNIGSIALRYAREFLNQSLFNQTRRLLTVDAIAGIITTLIVCFGAMILLRRTSNNLKNMSQVMKDIKTYQQQDAPDHRQVVAHNEFSAFIDSVVSSHENMDATINKARNLDEGKEE